MAKVPGRVSRIEVNARRFGRQSWIASGYSLARPAGTIYDPVHGEMLTDDAQMWMPEVQRFYGRRLKGVDLTAHRTLDDIDEGAA